jgi:choline dehydrogenase-like flavoprotein
METFDRRFDAIIIGSGAGGSIAAKELTERGLEVLLLEAGPDVTPELFEPPKPKAPRQLGMDLDLRAKAFLRGQYKQARRSFFSETSNRFLVNDWENPYTTPRDAPYLWMRSRLLGGRLNAYGRVLQRMSDVDFKAASRDGHGMDWPVTYADMEPWYDRVEEFIGVYGNDDPGVTHPPAGKYVGPAMLTDVEEQFRDKVAERWPERKVIAWRYAAPNLGRVPKGVAAGLATGRLTVRCDAVVERITVDPRTGLVDGAVFIDRLDKSEHRVFGDIVVLAASTIESIRLLVNSACDKHPNGLANSNGLLGRYFMDQTISLAFCGVPQFPGYSKADTLPEADPFYPPTGGILIPRYENIGPELEKGFLRGISFQGAGGRFPVPEGVPTSFGLGGVGEMLPMYENYVTSSKHRKDKWGIPAAHIRIKLGENDRILVDHQLKHLREMLEYAGYQINFIGSVLGLDSKKVWPDYNPVQRAIFKVGINMALTMGASIHECGGARMGDDPRTSVVNGVNQSWDIPNLFIPDGASFTSNSNVGPALTIMALAARSSAFIAEQHAQGSLSKPTEQVTY